MKALRNLLPKALRRTAYDLGLSAQDAMDAMFGRRDPAVPPRRLRRISTDPSADFKATGAALVDFLAAHCALHPGASVLDVGCGVGRLAAGLKGYFDASGRYAGFDIVPEEIEWCQRHLAASDSRFSFTLAGIANEVYNPKGRIAASEYRFPYADSAFDVAVVSSVFTHIFAADVDRYLAEIARTLKPGGHCMASFYLLTEESRRRMGEGRSQFTFRGTRDDCFVEDARHPELAVAFDEATVQAMFDRHRLGVLALFAGAWSSTAEQSQDLVILERKR